MIPIVTPAEMRVIDAAAPEPLDELIRRAAWHVARRARTMLGGVYGRRVAILAGPGNNGADGRVAGQILSGWGVRVSMLEPDADLPSGIDLVIDAAFGTGTNRPYEPSRVAAGKTSVLAVDIPSGIDGLTGAALGSPLVADHTVTFAALKPGLLMGAGPSFAGQVEVVDIGLDVSSASAWLFDRSDAAELWPERAFDDHKWKRAVHVIGGSPGMAGAPLLAARAGLRAGSGMVRCSTPGVQPGSAASELVFGSLPAHGWHDAVLTDEERFGSLVIGPGLGRAPETEVALREIVAKSNRPLVFDADALHLLGRAPQLRPDIVLTPHDGEYAALMGHAPTSDRFAAARELAAQVNATVLLKGPLTIVAHPNGHCVASDHGDARLATAGTGDVLAGMLGAYLAAGVEATHAAALAAWMHAEASHFCGEHGLVASDLIENLPRAAQQLHELRASP